jgi:hypothetical protein
MTTFLQDEASAEAGEPREGIEIQHGPTVYRIATGSRNVEINGNTFESSPGNRDEVTVAMADTPRELQFRLPVSHPFAQRYLSSPPQNVRLTVWRKQMRSGAVESIWRGTISGASPSGHVITFRSPSLLQIHMERTVPALTVGRLCPYVLYDENCGVPPSRSDVKVTTTVASFSGSTVTVATMGVGTPDQWAQYGSLLHVPSGERMTITSQVGTLLTLRRPIFELRDSDAVVVFAGCDHTINGTNGCGPKFGNKDNFGGAPQLPRGNLFVPNGFGIVVQE